MAQKVFEQIPTLDHADQPSLVARANRQLRAAAMVAQQLNATLDPEFLSGEIVRLVQAHLELDQVWLYLVDGTTGELRAKTGDGADQDAVTRAGQGREIVLVAHKDGSQMAVPLVSGDQIVGVLVAQGEPGRFDQVDRDTFEVLAPQIATAVQNARRFQKAQRTAERLHQVNLLQREFLVGISQDLRVPLYSVMGYSEAILMGLDGQLEPGVKESVQAIYESSQHLLQPIDDIDRVLNLAAKFGGNGNGRHATSRYH